MGDSDTSLLLSLNHTQASIRVSAMEHLMSIITNKQVWQEASLLVSRQSENNCRSQLMCNSCLSWTAPQFDWHLPERCHHWPPEGWCSRSGVGHSQSRQGLWGKRVNTFPFRPVAVLLTVCIDIFSVAVWCSGPWTHRVMFTVSATQSGSISWAMVSEVHKARF